MHGICGLDPTDAEAAAAGLPALDSVDQWAYLSGKTAVPPRTSLAIGTTSNPADLWAQQNDIVVHGFIEQDAATGKLWKLLVGKVPQAIWTGPEYPNATTATLPPSETVFGDCSASSAGACLFSLLEDEGEHTNLAASNPDIVSRLRAKIEASNKTVFAPHRPSSKHACEVSLQKYKDPTHDFGWWGPFAD